MKFITTNLKEFQDYLSYFSHFHDAYIKTITFLSHYETNPQGGGVSYYPGFDVMICFAHNSYADVPAARIIRAEFPDAKDLDLVIGEVASGELEIYNAEASDAGEGWIQFTLIVQKEEGNQFVHAKWNVLKFKKAILAEE